MRVKVSKSGIRFRTSQNYESINSWVISRKSTGNACNLICIPTLLLQKIKTANREHTVNFVKYLQSLRPNSRLLIIWDSYYLGEEFRDYLSQVNQSSMWKCLTNLLSTFCLLCTRRKSDWEIFGYKWRFFGKRCHYFGKIFSVSKWSFEFYIDDHLFRIPT